MNLKCIILNEEQTIIEGIIEENNYDPVENSNDLTIKVRNEKYFTMISDKKYGCIQIGAKVKITGTLIVKTNEIKNPTIEW